MENVLTQKIGNYIKMFAIGLFAIIFIYIVYDNSRSKEQIRVSTKTKDSLEALINKYEFDYTSLKQKADELDSIIKVKSENIRIVKERFYIYRDRKITNPDSATKFVKDFIKE